MINLWSPPLRLLNHDALTITNTFSKDVVKYLWIQHASVKDRCLEVSLGNSEMKKFPLVWLRDNCQCPKCFHPVSKSRTLLLKDFNNRPVLQSLQVSGAQLLLRWNDGHESKFTGEWLGPRAFDSETRKSRTEQNWATKQHWFAGFKSSIPRSSFSEALKNDLVFAQWLRNLQIYGVTILENAPVERGQVRKLTDKIGFIKKTHYGEEFQVQNKADPNNVAYTASELQLHTDLPYYEYKPGVNMLHCIVQDEGEGGENQLADGFGVAMKMKEEHPEAYKVLATTPIDWSDVGMEADFSFDKVHRAPVFCEDFTGSLYRVNYSQPQRDSYFPGPLDVVQPWYDALKLFCEMIYAEENMIRIKLNPGEVLTFDNRRVVHGRSAYGGNRQVEGAYVDWDEINSRLRVLNQNS